MSNFRVPGSREGTRGLRSFHKDEYLGIELKPYLATRMDASRGANESVESRETEKEDIVKITLEGDIELWTSVGAAQEDYGQDAVVRGGQPGLIFPSVLEIGRKSRGGGWAIKALEFFKVDLVETVATKIVLALEEKFEKQLNHGGPGLYRLDEKGTLTKPADFKAIMAKGPCLIFIHGTASSTEGGFGKFRDNKSWSEIRKLYDDRVFAFEHRTLSENPIENAIELVKALPKDAEIDIVSHSRGGLVAELICRTARVDESGNRVAAFDDNDNLIFEKHRDGKDEALKAELKSINELGKLLAAQSLRIRHLVRAGCPARGTTLASQRLDNYLSLIVSAMKLTGFVANPVFDLTMGLLLAVAKKRTDPSDVPGLEAQMPTSPLVAMLNREDVMLSNRLTVISGDIQGSGILGRLKVLATDLFYRDDHDLVVNTDAMYGGARRSSGGAVMFDKGEKVNHFSYFGNGKTAAGIANALDGKTSEKEGFKAIETYRTRSTRSRALTTRSGPSPVVYVLPGIMGSQIAQSDDLIWLNALRIIGGGIERIAWKHDDVTTDGIMDDYYGDLVEFLSGSHDVIAFDYDWRKSILTEGARLAVAVEKKMKETSQPVRFIGHSMGGLVVRAMAAQKPDLWNKIMQNPGARFVMLGTPNMGAFSIVATLLGRDSTIRKIEAIDFKHNMKELLTIVAQFPGLLELLPRELGGEMYAPEMWQKMRMLQPHGKWVVPDNTALADAEKTWKKIDSVKLSGTGLAYVAGFDKALTPMGIRLDNNAVKDKKIAVLGTPLGDGRVPWASGIPQGVAVWYATAAHGDLPRFKKAFPAYFDLLATGKTSQLETTPPAASRSAITELQEIEPAAVDVYPNEKDVLDAAMGVGPPDRAVETGTKIKVRIAHGDLNDARYAVTAGHYDGDTIRGAEGALDRKLHGRLNRKRSLGLYPGKIETAEFMHEPGERERGALIVGLGRFGTLTPGSLGQSYRFALLKYGEDCASTDAKKTALGLSTLIIGHRQSRLTLRDSLSAMLLALIDAKLKLQEHAAFEEFQIIELYEDTAISALRILRELAKERRISEHLDISLTLQTLRGKQRRVTPDDEPDWSRRIEIRNDGPNKGRRSLKFTLLSEAARASEVYLATQESIVDPYLKSLTGSTATNMRVAQTLFALMVPKEFKSHAADDRPVELILDTQAAAYPWELMADLPEELGKPPVIRAGMIRRLIEDDNQYQSVSASENRVVVIGDSSNETDSIFSELEGAQKEAETVATLFEKSGQNYVVEKLIKRPCSEIIEALLLTGAKIMHVATHGVFEHELPEVNGRDSRKVTGIVLGDGAFFTSAEVAQISPFPELVFLNCCHLGKMAAGSDHDESIWNNRHRLAANLAHQFIKSGAKAVIAAGWAVDDNAAMIFASKFYEQMLSGATFGKAVHAARGATYDYNPNVNTWGAYQCYGDPDYVLIGGGWGATPKDRKASSEAEVLMDLENLAEQSRLTSTRKLDSLREKIGDYRSKVDASWLKSSAIQQVLATAYANAGMIDEAVEAYRAAIDGKDGKSSLKAIEQFTNLSAKMAVRQMKASGSPPSKAKRKAAFAAIKKSLRQLENLQSTIGLVSGRPWNTVERLSLMGSSTKRLASIETGPQRIAALKKAAAFYEEAFDKAIKPDSGETNAYYPGINALLLKGLQKLCAGKAGLDDGDKARMELIRANFAKEDSAEPSFWALVAKMDLIVAECINLGKISDRGDDIITAFQIAWKRGGSDAERTAVLENFEFIEDCLEDKMGAEVNFKQKVRDVKERIAGNSGE